MGLQERFSFLNPGETTAPDMNNLQRWATQPLAGCSYLNETTANAPLLGSGAFTVIPFIPTGAVIKDPYAMIDYTADSVTFKETGLYFISYSYIMFFGSAVAVDVTATNILKSGVSNSVSSQFYQEDFPSSRASYRQRQFGILDLTSPALLGAYQMYAYITNFGGIANAFLQMVDFKTYLYSKTQAGKY